MNNHAARNTPRTHARRVAGFACVLLLFAAVIPLAQAADESSTVLRGTHIMGLEGARDNSTGNLTITGDTMQFQPGEGAPTQIKLTSIRDIFVGEEDRQVGGVPMMMGKAAIPYSGGRVVSLFSHKKYDSLTVEYVDANGALHGAIFRIAKGSGSAYKQALMAKGAHATPAPQPSPSASQEVKNETK